MFVSDVNECRDPSKYHRNAECFNVLGSYRAECRDGFTGDGINRCDGISAVNYRVEQN